MNQSKYFIEYDKDFVQENFVSCEREICKRLDWNFHQITPFHFFESLVSQGIFDEAVSSSASSDRHGQINIMQNPSSCDGNKPIDKRDALRSSRPSSVCKVENKDYPYCKSILIT